MHDPQKHYADLLIKIGVNLQKGQGLAIAAELAHAEFVRLLVASAYQAGAKFVRVVWNDDPSSKARLQHSHPDYLDDVPEYEVAILQHHIKENWARLALTGKEFPDAFSDVDPNLIRRAQTARSRHLMFYQQHMMADKVQWCVAAVPTPAWAQKVFPALAPDKAVQKLWDTILHTVRADLPDPIAAWHAHNRTLTQVVTYLATHQVHAVHFLDSQHIDGAPATDLTIGLTDASKWIAAGATTPEGIFFLPNMPTEETFTTPHNQRTNGYVRTSMPVFILRREVRNAYFKFINGEVTEFRAEQGQDTLLQFFQLAGAKRLGEVALVDVRSPIKQAGVLFYDTLFDENAACHIAFGKAYPTPVEGAEHMSEAEQMAFGLNMSDTHDDVMIGNATMQVDGICKNGSRVPIMRNGMFVDEIFAQKS